MIRKLLLATCLMTLPLTANAGSHIGGDAAAGERVFRKCKACHQVGPEAQNKVGPILNGVLNRAIGSVEDFKYSTAFNDLNVEGKVWTIADLEAFLTKPKDYAKGTKMAFVGLRKEEDRQNVIAYLATFGADGM